MLQPLVLSFMKKTPFFVIIYISVPASLGLPLIILPVFVVLRLGSLLLLCYFIIHRSWPCSCGSMINIKVLWYLKSYCIYILNLHIKTFSVSHILIFRFRTGLVYDELMLKHKNDWDPNFPEKPERISEPFKRCSELHLVERCIRIEV